METVLRAGVPEDAAPCGRIFYDAFGTLAERHGVPPDVPVPEVGVEVLGWLLRHPGFYGVVAERGGRIVGSNFLDERGPIAGVGPLTVDPAVQDAGIGRRLMLDVLARAEAQGFAGVRLMQAAYHVRSLSLYAKLGFQVRETLAVMQGAPPGGAFPGRVVRVAGAEDAEGCDRLCERVHGHHRGGELRDAIGMGAARVVERDGRIAGYTTGIGFFAHSVAETGDDLRALIAAADDIPEPGFLLPLRDGELFRWALEGGLRVVYLMTLMTVGRYDEPAGAWLPSVLY
jgi:predicted N-acetyltransferase YhbS